MIDLYVVVFKKVGNKSRQKFQTIFVSNKMCSIQERNGNTLSLCRTFNSRYHTLFQNAVDTVSITLRDSTNYTGRGNTIEPLIAN